MRADTLNAFAWLPLFALGVMLRGPHLQTFAAAVFLCSLVHQALTLPLVYADQNVRGRHRLVYGLGPIVIFVGSIGLMRAGLGYVAIVAAGWNAFHTLRQRYGLVRMYRRGSSSAGLASVRGGFDQLLIFGLFGAVSSAIVASPNRISGLSDLGMGSINRRILHGVDVLSGLAPTTFAVCAALVIVAAFRIGGVGGFQDRPVRVYFAGYVLSLVAAIVDPVAGLLALVGAHSLEYFFVVDANLGVRIGLPGTTVGAVTSAVRGPRVALLGTALLLLAAFPTAQRHAPHDVFLLAYMTVGGLHFLFDGVMWSSPRRVRAVGPRRVRSE